MQESLNERAIVGVRLGRALAAAGNDARAGLVMYDARENALAAQRLTESSPAVAKKLADDLAAACAGPPRP